MMLKQPDIAGINPVSRVMPVLVVESIGSTAQELGDRAAQFVKGQEYFARVLSNVGGTTFTVKVDGLALKSADLKAIELKTTDIKSPDLKNTDLKSTENKGSVPTDILLKMDLGASAKTGQTLSLRYMHSDPVPTFLLTPTPTNVAGSTTDISAAASLIGTYLKQAENDGVSSRLQATAVVTHAPNNAQVMAQDLKHAVSSATCTSGLPVSPAWRALSLTTAALILDAIMSFFLLVLNLRQALELPLTCAIAVCKAFGL